MDPIAHDCHIAPRAAHDSGERPLSKISLIVMHSTEGGGSAKNVAEYFHSPSSGGSAHLVIDDNECWRCLPNNVIPWGAPGANAQGFHIEQVGYAAWTAGQWEHHLPMLHRVAYKIAYHSNLFKIPLVFLDAAALRAGRRGVTTHAEVSKAWPNDAGNHHDPGPNWPWSLVHALALTYKREMTNV